MNFNYTDISYAPWDAEAEALIAEAGGNMYDVYPAAYLHLKPQLKVDGEVVGDFSDAISMGLPEYLWVETIYPGEGFPTHRETDNVDAILPEIEFFHTPPGAAGYIGPLTNDSRIASLVCIYPVHRPEPIISRRQITDEYDLTMRHDAAEEVP